MQTGFAAGSLSSSAVTASFDNKQSATDTKLNMANPSATATGSAGGTGQSSSSVAATAGNNNVFGSNIPLHLRAAAVAAASGLPLQSLGSHIDSANDFARNNAAAATVTNLLSQLSGQAAVPNLGNSSAPLPAQYALLLQSGALQGAANAVAQQLLQQQSTSLFPAPTPSSSVANLASSSAVQLLAAQNTLNAASNNHNSNQRSMASAISTASMHDWSLEQIEQHIALLYKLKQPVPQALVVLLADTKRREEKKNAKRIANRRSASTSRARKKALVKEMTELNARLRRQALILALLPDLVIVIDVEGVITFCSAQVERALHYKPDDLAGSQLADLLMPSSRLKLKALISELNGDSEGASKKVSVAAPTPVRVTSKKVSGKYPAAAPCGERPEVTDDSAAKVMANAENAATEAAAIVQSSTSAGSKAAPVAADPSFPLSVVKVDSTGTKPTADENSDTSGSRDSKQLSSLTNSASLTRSPTASSLGNSGSDDNAKKRAASGTDAAAGKELLSSDTSNTSTLSADAKKLQKANANLERNVRWHNKKLKGKHPIEEDEYTDDVIGAAVTANNATARLSSLRVGVARRPEPSSSEDDSGYRESNDSREETSSSSASDTSESNRRRKPLAPTCNICLIRQDLSTLWCEVTSSIRTRTVEEESNFFECDDFKPPPPPSSLEPSQSKQVEQKASEVIETGVKMSFKGSDSSMCEKERDTPDEVKEILLCLRPIRDGEGKVSEKHRFIPGSNSAEKREISESNGSMAGEPESSRLMTSSMVAEKPPVQSRPPKKRKTNMSNQKAKKRVNADPGAAVTEHAELSEDVPDTDVAESLMLMSTTSAKLTD